MKLREKKLLRPIASYRISVSICSHILGTEKDEHDETVVLHRINDEPMVRRAKLRQDRRGEHYFVCCGERMYIADYQPSKPHLTNKVYRYH